jgi:hypothetical protein
MDDNSIRICLNRVIYQRIGTLKSGFLDGATVCKCALH